MMSNPYGPNAGSAVYEFLNSISGLDPSSSAPSSPAADDLWYDKSNDLLKRYDGSDWQAAGATEFLDIPADLFTSYNGAAHASLAGARLKALLFDQTAVENAYAQATLPSHWESIDVDFYWYNNGATAGAVAWRFEMAEFVEGDSLNVAPSGPAPVSPTAGSQYELRVDTVATDVAVVPSKMLVLRATRSGSSGSDTLAADAGLVKVRLRNAAV